MYQYNSSVGRKRVCISFDWHNDRRYRHMLDAWIKNPNFAVDFEDLTPGSINTDSVSTVKGVLTARIRAATHVLVLIGKHANTTHQDTILIEDRNWIWWEINKAKDEGKGLIAVKLEYENPTPTPLYNSGATWAMSFQQDPILKALQTA